jgi:phage-related protein
MAASGYLPPVIIEILGSDKGLVTTLTKDKALLLAFAKQQTNAPIGADTRVFQTDLVTAKTELLAFAKEVTNANVGVDTAKFWAEIEALRAQLAAMSPLDINIDMNTASIMAQIAALKGELALAMAGAGGADGGLGALLGGGGKGGGGAANSLTTAMGLFHTMHLFAPEIVGLGAALFSVGAGFAALGIASIGAASDIYAGVTAVGAATNAMAAAIPGTTQWQKGVVALGQAWSTIPANLQPAVNSIRNFMNQLGNSPAATEIQGFLGGQAGILTGLFHVGSSTFEPLILATQRAIVTVEGMFKHGLGSGSLTNFVSSISRMVGPALIELVQLGGAILKIASGFARAVTDGQGMEVIVRLFQNLATVVNSGFFQGFIGGWVDLDRIVSTVIGLFADAIGGLGNLGSAMHGVGTVVGFAASAFLLLKAAAYLANTNMFGATAGAKAFESSVKGMTTKVVGFGLLTVGITGLVAGISQLTGVSDPLTSLWNGIAGALGFASKSVYGLNTTISGYTVQLSKAVPGTASFSAAMDLLVRSEQSIGSSLAGAATGFAKFTVKIPDSYKTMLANLNAQNGSLASWAVDAQKLLKKGMNPAAVAALAQQAPQDLSTMANATGAQFQQMGIAWQEHLMTMAQSGKTGIQGMFTAMEAGFTSGNPMMKAAAAQLATTIGSQMGTPFNGTLASIKKMAASLQTIDPSTLKKLNGQLSPMPGTAAAAAAGVGKVKGSTHSTSGTLLSMAGSLGMVVAGFAMVSGPIMGFLGAIGGAIGAVASFAVGIGETIAIVVGFGTGIAEVIVALVAIGVAAYELATHWSTVWNTIKSVALSVWNGIKGVILPIVHAVVSGVTSAMSRLESFISSTWTRISVRTSVAWNDFKGFIVPIINDVATVVTANMHIIGDVVTVVWHAIVGVVQAAMPLIESIVKTGFAVIGAVIKGVWQVIVAIIRAAWSIIGTIIKTAVGVVEGIIRIFAALLTGNWTALWNAIKSVVSTVWNGIWAIVSAAVGLVIGVITAFGTTIAGIWSALWNGLVSALRIVWGLVTSAVKTGIHDILAAFNGAGMWLFNIGKAIIQGLVNGIKSAIGAVTSAVKSVASGAVNAVKGLLGIASPSTVFAEIGANLGQGLVLGITGSKGMVNTALAGLVNTGMVTAAVAQIPGQTRMAMGGLGSTASNGTPGFGAGVTYAPTYSVQVTGDMSPQTAHALKAMLEQHDRELVTNLRMGSSRMGMA